jgi:hypothetical protein
MSSLFNVSLRSAETTDEESPQSVFGSFKIVRRVHRSEDLVGRYLPIKRGDESLKSFFADDSKNFPFRNLRHRSCFLLSMIVCYQPDF